MKKKILFSILDVSIMKIKCKSYPSTIQILERESIVMLRVVFIPMRHIRIYSLFVRDIQMNEGKKNVLTCN